MFKFTKLWRHSKQAHYKQGTYRSCEPITLIDLGK